MAMDGPLPCVLFGSWLAEDKAADLARQAPLTMAWLRTSCSRRRIIHPNSFQQAASVAWMCALLGRCLAGPSVQDHWQIALQLDCTDGQTSAFVVDDLLDAHDLQHMLSHERGVPKPPGCCWVFWNTSRCGCATSKRKSDSSGVVTTEVLTSLIGTEATCLSDFCADPKTTICLPPPSAEFASNAPGLMLCMPTDALEDSNHMSHLRRRCIQLYLVTCSNLDGMELELPAFRELCVEAYHEAVRRYATQPPWRIRSIVES